MTIGCAAREPELSQLARIVIAPVPGARKSHRWIHAGSKPAPPPSLVLKHVDHRRLIRIATCGATMVNVQTKYDKLLGPRLHASSASNTGVTTAEAKRLLTAPNKRPNRPSSQNWESTQSRIN